MNLPKSTTVATLAAVVTFLCACASPNMPTRYFGQTTGSHHSHLPYGNNARAGAYAVSDDGARIYYESYGSGEPIVVLHGGLVGSPAEMGQFIDRLSSRHRVIAISTRGHGRSQAGSARPSYTQKAMDVQHVLDAAGIRQSVSLLGFSDGGYTALTFAARYPERTARVVAIGAGEWKKGFVQGGRKTDATFSDMERLDPAYWHEQMTIRPEPQKTAQWFSAANAVYNDTQVGRETFGSIIRAPVLLVVGEDDANAPLDTVLAAHGMLPRGALAVIPDAGHPVFIQNFPAVWAVVSPFLDRR